MEACYTWAVLYCVITSIASIDADNTLSEGNLSSNKLLDKVPWQSKNNSNMRVDYGPWTSTPLDDYVRAPDQHYEFIFLKKFRGPNCTFHVLNMTSLKWLTEEFSDKPIWWHYLTIIVPDKVLVSDTAFVWVDQGSNHDDIPGLSDPFLALISAISVGANTVTATVKQIPNQPVVFTKDKTRKSRHEDALIAWPWLKFLENGSNPEILPRLPMTKAVVRAMDTVSTYVRSLDKEYDICKFVIGGASKRGWTTWMTAAVDKRVVAMVPVVMDLLNMRKSLHHHYRALGGWSFAFKDYIAMNVTEFLDSPNMDKMAAIIDPLTYSSRYDMPKLVVSATGDEFFMPDDSHYYYDVLRGPTYLKITPNAEHTLIGHIGDAILAIKSFYMSVTHNSTLPTFSWTRSQTDTGGRISVHTSIEPKSVTVFHAITLPTGRRDFRLFVSGPTPGSKIPQPVLWFKKKAKQISKVHYVAEVDRPIKGWAGFFVQLQFHGVDNTTLEFTTELCIVPDIFVFPECHGTGCLGKLV